MTKPKTAEKARQGRDESASESASERERGESASARLNERERERAKGAKTSKRADAIRSRIVSVKRVRASDLEEHPGNWRDHPTAQVDTLRGVMNEVGDVGVLLAYKSERNGGKVTLIDGHLRRGIAPDHEYFVAMTDLDDAEADYVLATHDPLAAMAIPDAGALDALMATVNSGEAAVQEMLAKLARNAGITPNEDPEAPEDFDEYNEDIETEHTCPKCGYKWSGKANATASHTAKGRE